MEWRRNGTGMVKECYRNENGWHRNIYIYMHISIFPDVCVYDVHEHLIYNYIYIHTYIYIYICMYVWMDVCMYECMHVCMYVCVYLCMYLHGQAYKCI